MEKKAMEEADDLNYDEPQNMDDGWDDGGDFNDAGNEGWESDDGMNAEDGKEADDWGDEGDWDEKKDMETQSSNANDEVINGYIVIRDQDSYLDRERAKIVAEVADELFIEKGQAEIALREFQWKRQPLQSAWFADDDAPVKMRKRLELTRKPDEWEDDKASERLKCCSYAGDSNQLKASSSRAEMKTTQKELYIFVKNLVKAGKNMGDILNHTKNRKFKARDVMKMHQIVTSEALASKVEIDETVCSRGKGWFNLSEGGRLNCGHGRCSSCWTSLLKASVDSAKDALTLKCNHLTCNKNHIHKYILGCFCTERIPREFFEKYLKDCPEYLEKYRKLTLQSFVDNAKNFNLRPCPNRECKLWYKKKSPKSDIVTCECTQQMCFNCGLPPHHPIPCKNALDWQRRASNNVQNEIWLAMNTAECPNPNCKVVIKRETDEKDRCLHMICTQCHYHWCWACREEFRPGGANQNHDNFYHCKLYEEGKLRPEVKEMNARLERMKREAANQKWCEHVRSLCDRDIKSLQNLQINLEQRVANGPGDGSKFKFLFDAISKLLLANEDKKRLYIVAFYAAMDNKKQLFQFQLKDMSEKTTKLLNMLLPSANNPSQEKSLKEYEDKGKEIHANTKIVSAFLQRLRRDIENGECVTILDKPDDKSTGWFCMACRRTNSFEKFNCECGACQVHGEQRCLRCNPELGVHF
mmetsp:Transcript_182/g.480  ORF Transcript_182/g.480 Transcript_182/m.480 type:complete len:697 (+) Transcript_182:61-2151(+)